MDICVAHDSKTSKRTWASSNTRTELKQVANERVVLRGAECSQWCELFLQNYYERTCLDAESRLGLLLEAEPLSTESKLVNCLT